MDREFLVRAMVQLRRLEQRLRRDAAGVQAGATEGGRAVVVLPLIYTGDAQLVLCCANARRVSGGACTDDYDFLGIAAAGTLRVAAHDDPRVGTGPRFSRASAGGKALKNNTKLTPQADCLGRVINSEYFRHTLRNPPPNEYA